MTLKQNKCLLVVLPYLVAATLDKTKKVFEAFSVPYGVMTMASFVKKIQKNSDCEILDLNTLIKINLKIN